MTAEKLWRAFCRKENIAEDTPYEAWQFGEAADELATLVMQKIKTATASGYDLYFVPGEEEPLPEVGEYSVILDANGQAVCVIQTAKVTVVPYDEVSAEHAYKEGEGDRSLSYWRKVHEAFFTKDFASSGLTFNHKSRILCEEFELKYSINEESPAKNLN